VDTPPIINKLFMHPCKVGKGTNIQVISAKGHFCAYPTLFAPAWVVASELTCLAPLAPRRVARIARPPLWSRTHVTAGPLSCLPARPNCLA